MDRVNAICGHPLYLSKMNTIRRAEAGRIYCRHDMQHLLDVARLMYIRVLEGEGDGSFPASREKGNEKGSFFVSQEAGKGNEPVLSKELIYAAALLHDIGRADQYENGTPHDVAGAEIARSILKDCGFDPEEISMITEAISGHRGTEEHCGRGNKQEANAGNQYDLIAFSRLLKEADKKSRLCFACEARDTCKWPDDKKNMEIEI